MKLKFNVKHTLLSVLAVAALGYSSAWAQLTHDKSILIQAKDQGGKLPVGITQNQYAGPHAMEFTTRSNTGKQATRMVMRGYANNADIEFYRGDRGLEQLTVIIKGKTGNVGIGTENPNEKLHVEGKIRATGQVGWPDFVFAEDYKLPDLSEVEKHIRKKGHLKDIPSEKEVLKHGIDLTEMDAKLLQKIEELTLYMIAQNKMLKAQQKEIEALKKKITE